MQALANAGIIVPDEIPPDEETVPLDFTQLSNRDIGSVHSRFAVRHAHAIFHGAMLGSRIAFHRRKLRMLEAQFRIARGGDRVKKTDVDALMEEDDEIIEARDHLTQVEAEMGIVQAVAQGYEDLRNAASREISRRIGEQAPRD